MLTGEKITVGPPFFNSTFVPLAIPLLLIVPFGQALAWKRGDVLAASQRLFAALAVALVVGLAVLAMTWGGPVMAPVGIGLGAYLLIGSALEIVSRARGYGASRARVARPDRAARGRLAALGVGHGARPCRGRRGGARHRRAGLGRRGARDAEARSEPDGRTLHGDPRQRRAPRQGPNYEEAAATLTIRTRAGDEVGHVETGKRFYPSRKMAVTESGLLTIGASQVYASLGEIEPGRRRRPAAVLQAAGAADLARGGGDGAGRRALAHRSADARRRPRQGAGCGRCPTQCRPSEGADGGFRDSRSPRRGGG